MKIILHNPYLRRFWFWHTRADIAGYGVTAYSLSDARNILLSETFGQRILNETEGIIEDVDISTLHDSIRGRIGPPNFRGIWYPCLNLSHVPPVIEAKANGIQQST